jgi:hypothetical protein
MPINRTSGSHAQGSSSSVRAHRAGKCVVWPGPLVHVSVYVPHCIFYGSCAWLVHGKCSCTCLGAGNKRGHGRGGGRVCQPESVSRQHSCRSRERSMHSEATASSPVSPIHWLPCERARHTLACNLSGAPGQSSARNLATETCTCAGATVALPQNRHAVGGSQAPVRMDRQTLPAG